MPNPERQTPAELIAHKLNCLAEDAAGIYDGFRNESMNGVVCSIPDGGVTSAPHRTYCARCRGRWLRMQGLSAKLDEVAAALRSLPAGETWRDMDSAPKDGTEVFIFGPHPALRRDDTGIAWFDPDAQSWRDEWHHLNPTHWMPLPTPPSPRGEEPSR